MSAYLLRGFAGLLLLLAASVPVAAQTFWAQLRDGTLHLRPHSDTQIQLAWQAAWQSDANAEQLYLLDGRGQLSTQVDMAAEQTQGHRALPLSVRRGDYRLVIPGYSFRLFSIRHDDQVTGLFEPVKLHFCAEVGRGSRLYFKILAGEQAVLAGKYHGGVSALRATRLTDAAVVHLPLQRHTTYPRYDQVALPTSARDEIWQLELQGSGKTAFWLDGSSNLFAQRPEQLYRPSWEPGQVHLTLGAQTRGTAPRLGVALPYAEPPTSSYPLLDILGVRAANYYSFVDVITHEPQREAAFRQLYQTRFGINHDITLLAGTDRRAVLSADTASFAGLRAWIDQRQRQHDGGLHYLAFADEPNLNYPDYASFARYFEAMLQQVQSVPGAREAGVRIAVPASSRWLGGPFRELARARRGIDWAQRLLAQHDEAIDALAWHEWMVRDLLATRRYRDSVQQAAKLVGLDPAGRPRKALLLSQTNISSGTSLSPYEQETHFAALWWASVVINASIDGLLDMLIWFRAADDADYPKGMLRQHNNGEFSLKPVGLAQQFIQQHWLSGVQDIINDAFEVDALALYDGTQRALLGVNKATRLQRVELTGADALCQTGGLLQLFGADSQTHPGTFSCVDHRVHFDLPGETLFALTWRRP